MFRLGRQLASAGRVGLAAPTPGRRAVSELASNQAGPSASSASSDAASTSTSLGYPTLVSLGQDSSRRYLTRPTAASEPLGRRVPTTQDYPQTRRESVRPEAQPRQRSSALGGKAAANKGRFRSNPWLARSKPKDGVSYTNDQVFAYLRDDIPSDAIDVLTSNDGDSPPGFDPSTPSSAAALRRLARCIFNSRHGRKPVTGARLRAFIKYVLRRELRDPWVLLYAIAIMSGQLAEPTLLSALEAAVREGRDGWPEAQAKHAFESGPRLKQVMLAELDEFRTQLPLDIQLSWDPILEHKNALAHCVRLINFLNSTYFAHGSANDILAFINPSRQSDMDEHPFGVIFLLETLRQAKARDSVDGQAGAVYDATVALLPELAEPWKQTRGLAFDLRSVTPNNRKLAEKHVGVVYAAAETYLTGSLRDELGEAGLEPWIRAGFLSADGQSADAVIEADR